MRVEFPVHKHMSNLMVTLAGRWLYTNKPVHSIHEDSMIRLPYLFVPTSYSVTNPAKTSVAPATSVAGYTPFLGTFRYHVDFLFLTCAGCH